MAEQQLERSMLDGKDREQLHAIAGAMGIKGVTRLKKADLVDAILGAATGNGAGNGAANGDGAANGKAAKVAKPAKATKATKTTKAASAVDDPISSTESDDASAPAPRRAVRSKRASELAAEEPDLAEIAAEQNALGGGEEPEIAPRPMRRSAPSNRSSESAVPETGASATSPSSTASTSSGAPATTSSGAPTTTSDDERASFGEGNTAGTPNGPGTGRVCAEAQWL